MRVVVGGVKVGGKVHVFFLFVMRVVVGGVEVGGKVHVMVLC